MDREQALQLLEQEDRAEQLARSQLVAGLAVLATFDPARLQEQPDGGEVLDLLCHRLPPTADGRAVATVTDATRIDVLAAVLAAEGRAGLARLRARTPADHDTPVQRVLDAFVHDDFRPLDAWDEDELLAWLDVWWWVTEAVARAGRSREVVVAPSRDQVESRLGLLDVTRAVRRLTQDGCLGREEELQRLHAYCWGASDRRGLAEDPPMLVYGIGGVGKSTLVARFVMDLYERGRSADPLAWAYLDLDRPTLSSGDPAAVLTDVLRQVAAQFPEQRRAFERAEAVLQLRGKGAGLEALDTAASPYERVDTLARAVRAVSRGWLVVVLDTFEELERTSPRTAAELYDAFAALATELPDLRLVVAGRAPAATFSDPTRPDRSLHVLPLPHDRAAALLRVLVEQRARTTGRPVPAYDPVLADEIVGLVGGIPLTLRLAARVLVQEGPQAVLDVAARARAVERVREEVVRGFLYQRVLEHITTDDARLTAELRAVARASLVLHEVTPELVERVLVPALTTPVVTAAPVLFVLLAREVALAHREGDRLLLREDLRGPALAALRVDDAALVQRVHRRAAEHYAEHPRSAADAWSARVEAAYHSLALGALPADLDPAVLRELEPSLGDLPQASAAVVRSSLTDPAALAPTRDLAEWERRVLPEAEAALRTGQPGWARSLLAERPERTDGSELHRLESRLAEAEGDLEAAAAAAQRDLDAATAVGNARRYAAAAVRLARLAEQRGRADEAARTLERSRAHPLLHGHHELRLELVLALLATLERACLDDEELRWSLGLEARALLQRLGAPRAAADTGLLRLLAAALGREEPERLREAAHTLGVGHEEDPVLVAELVDALTTWDLAQSRPGTLARTCGLRVDDPGPASVRRAWTALTGLGTDAGIVLDRLWARGQPPPEVREALRRVYLWWAVDRPRGARPGLPPPPSTPPPPSHAPPPSSSSVDWSRPEMLALEEVLLSAYPTSTHLRALADRAGVASSAVSWTSSGRRTTRELLGTATRAGRLHDLVQAVLDDESASSFHDQVRRVLLPDAAARRPDSPA